MIQCTWCGYPLQPGVITCPSCGTAVPTSENNKPEQFFQGMDAPTLIDAPLKEWTPGGQTPIAQKVEPPSYFSMQPQQMPFANAQTQPLAYAHQPVPAMPPSNRRRSRLSRGATIIYTVLALIAMFSGVALILYSAVIHPAQLHQQATATAVAQMNLEASQTALANAQASATAVAVVNATGTAIAIATAQAVATATALQNIYTQATSGAAIINDSLSGDNYNWDIGTTNDGGGCFFSGGAFHASVRTKGFFLPCIAHATNFSNFAFQISMTFAHGNSGGIAFRINANQQNGYLFNVTLGGLYGIFIIKNNQAGTTLTSGQSASINTRQNAANLLTIVARGSNIFMYVNKQFVASVNDSTYAAGQIGVFASDDNMPSESAFTKAQIWKL
jgi:zinc-ribbon domain